MILPAEAVGTSGVSAVDSNNVLSWLTTNWHPVVIAFITVSGLMLTWLIHVRGGFRTTVKAWIDRPRERIRVMVRNRGATSGQIHSVSILSHDQLVDCVWLCDLTPQNYTLEKHSVVFFLAEAFGQFPTDAKVRVRLNGKDQDRRPRRSCDSWQQP